MDKADRGLTAGRDDPVPDDPDPQQRDTELAGEDHHRHPPGQPVVPGQQRVDEQDAHADAVGSRNAQIVDEQMLAARDDSRDAPARAPTRRCRWGWATRGHPWPIQEDIGLLVTSRCSTATATAPATCSTSAMASAPM